MSTNLEHWNQSEVESMYDKHLLAAEIALIKEYLDPYTKILDTGCGEGEGTVEYVKVPGIKIHAADFSDTRLQKARKRLSGMNNVELRKVDFLQKHILDNDYDIVLTQRFLINLPSWDCQKDVLSGLTYRIRSGGKIILCEGSNEGVRDLDEFRAIFGLPSLPVAWHNVFFNDRDLVEFMEMDLGCSLVAHEGLSGYYLLTRGIKPVFEKDLNWDCVFNKSAADCKMNDYFKGTKGSKIKLWVFQR